MRFPTTSTKRRAIALVAFSMFVLGGCKPAEQQIGDMHVLKVPSVYPWQASPLGRGVSFPALDKALAATANSPNHSVEIALDFPLHPGGFPYPQGVGSYGTINIKRGSVRFSAGDAYIILLPDKRLLCKPTKDSPELRLHYPADSDYQIGITAGRLCVGVVPSMNAVKMPGTSAASRFQKKSMAILFVSAFELSAAQILTEIWGNGV